MSRETYVIHVTKKCNMNCRYCYEQDKQSEYTWEEIKKFIDQLVSMRTSDNFTIEFLGGDPMLAWEHIVSSYEYLESIEDINIDSYVITCNGTIMTDNIIEYLKNNKKLYWAISLDGHKFSNQLRTFTESGKNSYDAVMENIRKAKDNDIDFGIHMVSHPYNVGMIYSSIKHLYERGIYDIDVGIVESTITIDKDFAERYVSELYKVSEDIVLGKMEGLSIGILNYMKPVDDCRTYIRDENGKTIAESYGRSGDDVTSKAKGYHIIKCVEKSEVSKLIDKMRAACYNNHQRLLNKSK